MYYNFFLKAEQIYSSQQKLISLRLTPQKYAGEDNKTEKDSQMRSSV